MDAKSSFTESHTELAAKAGIAVEIYSSNSNFQGPHPGLPGLFDTGEWAVEAKYCSPT